jgi:EmrB/QacA subfamily drug resistance transporter
MSQDTKQIYALIGISLFSFTGYLDATIVSTALPSIQSGLHMSVSGLQWVMNAFFLLLSAFMASIGRVADLYGRRKVFYIGVILFAAASVGAGLSPNGGTLIFFRALQGLTTAITIPVGVTLIHALFDKEHIAKAMGIFSAMTGAGLALGPVVGGILVSSLGWEWVFFINIPFIIVGFCFCLFTVKESRSEEKIKLDYAGMLLLALTIGAVLYGFSESNTIGWNTTIVITSFIVAGIALIAFVVTESFASFPVMSGATFKNPAFLPILIFSLTAGGMMSVMLFINPLYLHTILNQSNLDIGLFLFAMPVVVVCVSPIIGRFANSIGLRTLLVSGAILYVISAIMSMFFPLTLGYGMILATFIIFGLAWAIFNTSAAVAIGQSVPANEVSVALGSMYSFYNIGAAILLAVGVTLFHNKVTLFLLQKFNLMNLPMSKSQHQAIASFVTQPDHIQSILKTLSLGLTNVGDIFKEAFLAGMADMFWPVIVLAVLSTLLLLIYIKPLNENQH